MAVSPHILSTCMWSVALAALVAMAWLGDAKAGEQKWSPTVVSTVAGSPAGIPQGQPVRARLPQWSDPRYVPKQIYTRQSGSLPDGAWSSIVTGAVPEAEGQAPQQAPGAAAAAAQAPAGDKAQGAGPTQADIQGAANDPGRPPRDKPLQGLPPDASPAQQYCFNTADSAAEARFAWQQKKIKDMEAELEKRAQQLQERTEEYKAWLARRDEFSRKAQDKLVAFYAKMKADAAGQQIAAMDEDIAAALLMKLEPKVASLVLAEIEPTKAAKLAGIISGLSKVAAAKKQRAASAAPAPASPGAPQGAPVGAPMAPGAPAPVGMPQASPSQAPQQAGVPRS